MDNPVQPQVNALLRALLEEVQFDQARDQAPRPNWALWRGKALGPSAVTREMYRLAGVTEQAQLDLENAVESNRVALEAYLTTAPPPSSNGSSPPSLRLESTPRNPGVLWEKFNETKEGSHT